MAFPYFIFLVFSVVSAQSLLNIGSLRPDLSLFFGYINANPTLNQQFAAADNFTLLAPTNDAVAAWLLTLPSPSLIQATVQYHLLQGTHSSASLNTSGSILISNLNDTAFVNITQGQSVKAFNNGTFHVESWLKEQSNIASADNPVDGGLVHTIDTVLTIPQDGFRLLPLANLTLAVSILSAGKFFSKKDIAFTNSIAFQPNVTFFMPNSTLAEVNFKPEGRNQDSLNRQFAYHCVEGLVYADDFEDGVELQTIAGESVRISKDEDGNVFVNDAKVVGTDYLVNNGVMHVIDDVLNPDNITLHTSLSPPLRFSTKEIIEIAFGAAGFLVLLAGTIFVIIRQRRRTKSSLQEVPAIEERAIVKDDSVTSDWDEDGRKMVELEELESLDGDRIVKELSWKIEEGIREFEAPTKGKVEPVEMLGDVPERKVYEKGEDMG